MDLKMNVNMAEKFSSPMKETLEARKGKVGQDVEEKPIMTPDTKLKSNKPMSLSLKADRAFATLH